LKIANKTSNLLFSVAVQWSVMNNFVILLRGINVGGKNTVSMATLRTSLEDMGFSNVRTYINSGNVLLSSELQPPEITKRIEAMLPLKFNPGDSTIKILVLSYKDLKAVVDESPKKFGADADTFHSDVIFLIGITPDAALKVFSPREGIDSIWPGSRVIYSQRLSAERTKSRLNRIVGTDAYKSMTIRTWATVKKLLGMLEVLETSGR
jgi:uncharacterized protein (DUF1697 family)